MMRSLRRLPQVGAGTSMHSNILLLGPPGVGQGDAGRAHRDELRHPACRDRRHAPRRDRRPEPSSAGGSQPIYDAGELVPDDLMVQLIRERLAQATRAAASSSTASRARSRRPRRSTRMLERARPVDRRSCSHFQLPEDGRDRAPARPRASRRAAPTTRPRRSARGWRSTTARPSRSSSTTARREPRRHPRGPARRRGLQRGPGRARAGGGARR